MRFLLTWVLASSATLLLKNYGDNDSETWSYHKAEPFLGFLWDKFKKLIATVIITLAADIIMIAIPIKSFFWFSSEIRTDNSYFDQSNCYD